MSKENPIKECHNCVHRNAIITDRNGWLKSLFICWLFWWRKVEDSPCNTCFDPLEEHVRGSFIHQNWEAVTDAILFTFVNTGQSLEWKIESSGNAIVTNIQIQAVEGT